MTNTLTAASSADALLAALQAQPNLIRALSGEAGRAHEAIRLSQVGLAALGLADFWLAAQQQIASSQLRSGRLMSAPAVQDELVTQLRLALEARDLLVPVAADLGRLDYFEAIELAGTSSTRGTLTAEGRAVMAKYPGLKGLLEWRDARGAERAEAQRRDTERQVAVNAARVAAERQEAARALVKRLAGVGVMLSAAKGGIMARPMALLDDNAAAAVKALRPELMELLAAPAELVA